MPRVMIVESPTKAKTLSAMLPDFTVVASCGHIIDLPQSPPRGSIGVEVTDGKVSFPNGMPPLPGKEKTISTLKRLCKGADVYLASDPDREGELIAWCVQECCCDKAKSVQRITFNAITKGAVEQGLKSPRAVDMNLVGAALARRSLDRIVGYTFSPQLCRERGKKLSIGRVQTALLDMVVSRDKQRENFKPEPRPRWEIDLPDRGMHFTAQAWKETGLPKLLSGDKLPSMGLSVRKKEEDRKLLVPPPLPFTTSTLQQACAKEWGWKPKKTMEVAQSLFERHHKITYHRTDSSRFADETRNLWRGYVKSKFNLDCKGDRPLKSGAGDAHEAIHPTDPYDLGRGLSGDEALLYNLILSNFELSLMPPATSVIRTAQLGDYPIYSNQNFYSDLGWRQYSSLDSEKESWDGNSFSLTQPTLDVEVKLEYSKPPASWTLPTLLSGMEKEGIGRPATSATAVETLFSRGYVSSKGKSLQSTPLGLEVLTWAKEHCPQVVDINYTSLMEKQLDEVVSGSVGWEQVVTQCYKDLVPSTPTYTPSRSR